MLTRTIWCSFVITIVVVSVSNAQSSCTTNFGANGQCVLIEYCQELYSISIKPSLTATDRRILAAASSPCTSQGLRNRVCCPDNRQPESCQTPNNTPGTCISLRSCAPLYALLLQRPISQTSLQLLQSSQCGVFDQKTPRVCCPNFQPIPQPTPPPVQINEIDTGTGSIPISPLLPTNAECGLEQTFSNIYGGERTDIREFPWMVLLQYRTRTGGRQFACGGSIINRRYVMTAAHCVKGRVLTSVGPLVNVRVGEYDISTEPDCVVNQGCNTGFTMDVGVEETIPHPGWIETDPAQLNDIALIRLNRDLTFNEFVQPICLPNKGLSPTRQDNLVVAGWGRVNATHNSNIKMKLRIPSLPLQTCQNRYQSAVAGIRLSEAMQFCAGGEEGRDSCSGDSGGPVVNLRVDQTAGRVNYLGMGIVSFGPENCGQQGVPGVYTKVSAHINWILSNIRA